MSEQHIKAEALREAAEWFANEAKGKTADHYYPYAHGARWLRAEADRIEQEGDSA